MAKWSFNVSTWTPVAVADTTNLTNGGYMAIQGGSSTQVIKVIEIYMGGLAGASTPSLMVFARDSTVAVGMTALSTNEKNAAFDPATAALAAAQVPFTSQGTTAPKRSSTLGLLTLGLNAFGGIVRWVAAPGEEIGMLGNTASLGEVSLTAYTGGTPGLINSHIIYEPS